jgi:fermentation-respiration switch protein FrsA (DUF1100 family)
MSAIIKTAIEKNIFILIGTGFSQYAYNMAKDPRELFIIEGATHMDLYDKEAYVPAIVEKLTDFFSKNL